MAMRVTTHHLDETRMRRPIYGLEAALRITSIIQTFVERRDHHFILVHVYDPQGIGFVAVEEGDELLLMTPKDADAYAGFLDEAAEGSKRKAMRDAFARLAISFRETAEFARAPQTAVQ